MAFDVAAFHLKHHTCAPRHAGFTPLPRYLLYATPLPACLLFRHASTTGWPQNVALASRVDNIITFNCNLRTFSAHTARARICLYTAGRLRRYGAVDSLGQHGTSDVAAAGSRRRKHRAGTTLFHAADWLARELHYRVACAYGACDATVRRTRAVALVAARPFACLLRTQHTTHARTSPAATLNHRITCRIPASRPQRTAGAPKRTRTVSHTCHFQRRRTAPPERRRLALRRYCAARSTALHG